jgi:exonuclease SbcD
MRFLHTSDLHLGKILHNTSLLDIQAKALAQITDILRDRDIDGLIIAGDLYDRSIPPEDAVTLLNSFYYRGESRQWRAAGICSKPSVWEWFAHGGSSSGVSHPFSIREGW